MTEAEWLESDNHIRLTYYVAERMSLRKLRLVEVAVCRRLEHHLVDDRSRHALEVCEAYANGLVSEEVLAEASSQADAAYKSLLPHINTDRDAHVTAALYVCCAVCDEYDLRMRDGMIKVALGGPKPPPSSISPELRAANFAEAALVRDVLGNPFRPFAFSPLWRTSTAIALAQQMYDSRDFSAMPILGDALEDAGCDNADILDHCRDEGQVHVRGCWVVDLVLGKE